METRSIVWKPILGFLFRKAEAQACQVIEWAKCWNLLFWCLVLVKRAKEKCRSSSWSCKSNWKIKLQQSGSNWNLWHAWGVDHLLLALLWLAWSVLSQDWNYWRSERRFGDSDSVAVQKSGRRAVIIEWRFFTEQRQLDDSWCRDESKDRMVLQETEDDKRVWGLGKRFNERAILIKSLKVFDTLIKHW